ncbi:MAG: sulfotransferase [Candidatus Theseobacter exili]|nr:sulfotransferase [Candidatus Theseobacter exili]
METDILMKFTGNKVGPVAIGGCGGNGTRVVALLMQELGYYIGTDRNKADDNLWFTLLFRRKNFFRKRPHQIEQALSIFDRTMNGKHIRDISDIVFLMRAVISTSLKGNNYKKSCRGLWPFKRVSRILNKNLYSPSTNTGWGWKEPNTHIYLEHLNNHFGKMRYIHIIRHGLDMAFSHNITQLYNWGWFFDIDLDHLHDKLPQISLKYWIKANNRAIFLGKKLFNERFLLIKYDQLCLQPETVIPTLVSFLGVDSSKVNIESLLKIPRRPESLGRYKNEDLSIFSDSDIESVKNLGFSVELKE